MHRTEQLKAWKSTAGIIKQLLNGSAAGKWSLEFESVVRKAEMANPWFTKKQVITAMEGICRLLDPEILDKWTARYQEKSRDSRMVGIIMAGNIPLAGFHDFLCVTLSGHNIKVKLSASDPVLLPFISAIYFSFLPGEQSRVSFVSQLREIDAVIATGSNNTSRYFEYYFGKLPHVFRKNRNSAAVISGSENEYDFILLGRDIFTYFGLGCRNVSKLFVPAGYDFSEFFRNITAFSDVMQHNKYMNNFDYHQALFLLNRQPFLTNNFLLLTENSMLASPVSVLNYEFYNDDESLQNRLRDLEPELQCVVSKKGPVLPGNSQLPAVDDYADGVDTMKFLSSL